MLLIIVLIISLKHSKKFVILKYFPLYARCLMLVFLSMVLYYIALDADYDSDFFLGLTTYLDNCFTLLELIFFSHFYYQYVTSPVVRKLIISVNISFIFFFVLMAISDNAFYTHITEATKAIVYTFEGVVLLLLCSYYFINLFKNTPVIKLKNEPVFWAPIGLFFFMSCTLPYSLLENTIRKNYPDSFLATTYSIFHVFYALLFLMIIRAYLCTVEKMI